MILGVSPTKDAVVPLLAQMMGIVDVFDALTTDRPYRAAFTVVQATEELWRDVARGWRSADIVAMFLDHVRPN
jgi:cyclic di-GMP phosphodiesterase